MKLRDTTIKGVCYCDILLRLWGETECLWVKKQGDYEYAFLLVLNEKDKFLYYENVEKLVVRTLQHTTWGDLVTRQRIPETEDEKERIILDRAILIEGMEQLRDFSRTLASQMSKMQKSIDRNAGCINAIKVEEHERK